MSYTKKPTQYSSFSFKPMSATGIILVLAAAIVLSGYLFSSKFWSQGRVGGEATLILSFENGGKGRMFQGEVIDGMTVLSALIASSEAGQIKLQYSFNSENKAVIESLNGYSRDSKPKITFYLNNNHIDTGDINQIPINGGDIIEAKLE